MTGTVEKMFDTYGFIRGTDGVSRFFLPTALQMTQEAQFDDIVAGTVVQFAHIDHPRGPRAIEVLVVRQQEAQ